MYAKEGYPIIEIVGANNSDKDKAVVIDGKVTQNYEVEQHITEVTNNVYVVAKDSTARCYFTKFEKTANIMVDAANLMIILNSQVVTICLK